MNVSEFLTEAAGRVILSDAKAVCVLSINKEGVIDAAYHNMDASDMALFRAHLEMEAMLGELIYHLKECPVTREAFADFIADVMAGRVVGNG